ncbi:hypothetical protein G6F42_010995 [Rhizopus arrhizus]|nr:hypothetical protein G6F42_010995 [Rhizopus arrhizus]
MDFEEDEQSQDQDRQQQQKLQTAIWHQVNEIVKDQGITSVVDSTNISTNAESTVSRHLRKDVSEAFVASLAEVVMTQMQTMATDLEAFAGHGKRAVISMEDVKLCSRRNDSLYQLISDAAKDIAGESNSRKHKK